MKRRILSGLLVLVLLVGILPVTALAAPARIPIYTGYIQTDYMAQQILQEIPTAGKSAREQILAVYDWIIAHCNRYNWDGTCYFSETDVANACRNGFSEEVEKKYNSGQIIRRQELGSSTSGGHVDYDSNYYIASFAYEMMLKRTGNCAHYSSLLTVLLGHLGFDSRIFHGSFINMDGSVVEHTWNYILIDGTYYWADIRIDHAVGGHDYFLIEDTDDWAEEHIWDNEDYSDWLAYHGWEIQADLDELSEALSNTTITCSPWATEYMERAHDAGLIPDRLIGEDLTRQITRAEFAAVAVALYETLTWEEADCFDISPFSDTDDLDVLKAYTLGVVNGMGDGTFAPDAPLTREQAVTMLGRVYELVLTGTVSAGEALPQEAFYRFTDHNSISNYALDYVYFFVGQSIVDGMGDGTFAPQAQMTREQAIKIAVETALRLG